MALSKVINANEASFDKIISQAKKPVLVDFYADWCGPCKMLGPILDQLSKDFTDAYIIKINIDDNQALAAKFTVRSVPTMIIFKNGKQVETIQGVVNQTHLEAKLKKYI